MSEKAAFFGLLKSGMKGVSEGAKLVEMGKQTITEYIPEDVQNIFDDGGSPEKRKGASEVSPLINSQRGGNMAEVEIRSKSFFEKYIQSCGAECLGMAIFVFMGTISVQLGSSPSGIGILPVGLVHGLTIFILIASFGHLSGGHFNPVVTLGALLSNAGLHYLLALAYVVAQLLGAIIGSACCRGVLSYYANGVGVPVNTTVFASINGGAHGLAAGMTPGQGLLCETIMTMLLVLAVLTTAVDTSGSRVWAALAIGLTVGADIIAGGTQTGGSMNPARSFGPAVVMSDIDASVWKNHWIYWVGPIMGSLLAVLFYRLLFAASDRRVLCKGKED